MGRTCIALPILISVLDTSNHRLYALVANPQKKSSCRMPFEQKYWEGRHVLSKFDDYEKNAFSTIFPTALLLLEVLGFHFSGLSRQ